VSIFNFFNPALIPNIFTSSADELPNRNDEGFESRSANDASEAASTTNSPAGTSTNGQRSAPNLSYAPDPGYAPNPSYASNPSYAPNQGYAPNPSYAPNQSYAPNPSYTPNPSYASNPSYDPNPSYAPNQSYAPNPSYAPGPNYAPNPSVVPYSRYSTEPSYAPGNGPASYGRFYGAGSSEEGEERSSLDAGTLADNPGSRPFGSAGNLVAIK
jgi:hypothetical protein